MTRTRTLYLPVMIAAAVLLACAVVVLVVSEKAEATFPGENGRIAYASYDAPLPKGDSEIYTIKPDGSGKRQLTNNDREDIDPAYSPDGKKIVYASAAKPKGNYELYTIDARGGNKVQVTNNDVDEAWPPTRPTARRSPIWDPTARSTPWAPAGEGSPNSPTTMRTPRSSPGVLVRSRFSSGRS